MAYIGNINCADAVVTLRQATLFSTGVLIEKFAPNAVFDFTSNEMATVLLGADGEMAAGSKPALNHVVLHLMGSSPANRVFEAIGSKMMNLDGNVYPIDLTIELPAAGKIYYINGAIYVTPQQGANATDVIQPYAHELRYSSRNYGWVDLATS